MVRSDHPDVVERYVGATIQGSWRFQTHKQLAIKAMRSTRANTTPSIDTRPTITTSPTSARLASRVPECLQQNLKIAEENILETKDANPAQFVDTSIVEKINASGFIKTLWERIVRSPLTSKQEQARICDLNFGKYTTAVVCRPSVST
jgi:hypothetical protein